MHSELGLIWVHNANKKEFCCSILSAQEEVKLSLRKKKLELLVETCLTGNFGNVPVFY